LIGMTLGEVAEIVHGRLSGADPRSQVSATVEFDSREARPGGLFLALPGGHVDGHSFVGDAIASGAVAAIVTQPVDAPSIVVADGRAALAALATAVARRLPDTLVIGITGSSGKTSTKDVLAQVLQRLGPTVAPPESFNNELGHPYTVLRATTDTRFLVLEVSARGIGHIRELTRIAPPRIGVVLNVGSAHLGEFGSRKAIADAKGELIEALPADGIAVLNADDPLVSGMRTRTAARVVSFGTSADVRASGVTLPVQLQVSGEHQVANALAAATAALACGMPLPDVAAALSAATPRSKWRMEITERPDGVLVINDAYNANPESMRAALRALAGIGRSRAGHTWAVLGGMAELGAASTAEHEALGRAATELGISRLVSVGESARGIDHGSRWVPDADAAIALLCKEIQPGDVVLVKASRAIGLERVALELAQ